MVAFEDVRRIVGDVLQLGERTEELSEDSLLLGSLPEFDSMAVVSIITAIEEQFDIIVDDDDISAETFESMGSLHAFVNQVAEET